MKTIEELADEYVDAPCEKICSECNTIEASCRFYNDKLSFIDGANAMYRELTRWNDPKVELPEKDKDVIVKYIDKDDKDIIYYTIGKIYGDNKWDCESLLVTYDNFKIIGWREIYE